MFKFELGHIVWYLGPEGVYSAPVQARMAIENLHQERAYTKEQQELYTPWGKAGVFYNTCHGVIEEAKCYGSREELGQAIIDGKI